MHPRLRASVEQIRKMLVVLEANEITDPAVVSGFRRRVAEADVLTWALVYCPMHLTLDDGSISLSDIHAEWVEHADDRARRIYIAPRGAGKSTWHYLIIPLYLAATGRRKFIAAFSDSGTQAELHLSTLKLEMARNDRLRQDYPDLCAAGKRPTGASVADNQALLFTKSGFAFAARGADGSSLGIKLGDQRPDHLLLDDIEPHASAYSAYQAEKRLATLTDAILPMGSQTASCTVVGTTTMRGSIIHQAVHHSVEPASWIDEENFTVHHALPFDDAGESVWPERWSTEYLRSIEGTRSFRLSFLNEPATVDGEYWVESDFSYGTLPSVSKRIVVVDPAVTTNRTSDETGVAVISYSAAQRMACVEEAFGIKVKGEPLRQRVLGLIQRYPDIAECYVERNQGGEMMVESVFHDMPVPVETKHNSIKKEIRIETLLSFYRRGVVLHARKLPALEDQQREYPHVLTDDVVDVVAIGMARLAGVPQRSTLRRAVA
jgi:hypothetical protein